VVLYLSGEKKGSVAKNLNIEAKLYFHRNDYKKADDFSENMQI
jgi:hypothetical protein